jgi:hypothetical protein
MRVLLAIALIGCVSASARADQTEDIAQLKKDVVALQAEVKLLKELLIELIKSPREPSSPHLPSKVTPQAPQSKNKPPENPPTLSSQGTQQQQTVNNMKEIGLAFHNFALMHQEEFPPAAICDKDGKPLLSWRVLILPFIEEDALYRQIKLDEAWDGPNNKKLLDRMPKIYALPGVETNGQTHFQLFVGPGTLYSKPLREAKFALPPGLKTLYCDYRIGNIPDGTSNTILVAESATAVPWTKPDDIVYDPKKPLPKLGKMRPDQFLVGMCDGSVRWVDLKKVSEKTLRNAINPAVGERLGKDW